jgi:hypothetical protein
MNVATNEHEIHISDLDEFLALKFLDDVTRPMRFSVLRKDTQGNIIIQQKDNDQKLKEGGIDFELSPSEYQSLDSINVTDFINKTVYTSSAYEFLDFILMYYFQFEFLTEFNGSSWQIRILNGTEDQ